MKIVLGDCNTQVGSEPVTLPIVGRHSLHPKSDDNGTRLVNLAASQDMVVGSTIFDWKTFIKLCGLPHTTISPIELTMFSLIGDRGLVSW